MALLCATVVISGCGAQLPFVGNQSQGAVAGITDKLATIRICAETLGDMRAASSVATTASTGSAAEKAAIKLQLVELTAKLRARAAEDPRLKISFALGRLVTALNVLNQSLVQPPAAQVAAAQQVAGAAERVVSHCAAMGT